MKTSIITGEFAEVFSGNSTTCWLPEGEDLQARANSNIDPYWLTEGRDCPIYRRHVSGYALVYHSEFGDTHILFDTLEAAESAQTRHEARNA